MLNHRIREGVIAKQPICAEVLPRREPNEVKLNWYINALMLGRHSEGFFEIRRKRVAKFKFLYKTLDTYRPMTVKDRNKVRWRRRSVS